MDSIKVLWVDDQDFEEIENYAYDLGIDITHVHSWDEAESHLKGFQFEQWTAIILDCYCTMFPNGPEDRKFLKKVLERLSLLSQGRLLPWYVLSRGTDQDFLTIIDNQLSEQRELWDEDWNKIYYSKTPEDYHILFERILKMAPNLDNYKVRHRFKEVFNFIGIEELFISNQVEAIMFPVLKSLLYPDESNQLTPLYHYNQLRQAVEWIFRSCHRMGLLPDALVLTKTGVNLSLSSHYLSGHNAKLQDVTYRYGDYGDYVFPHSISKVVKDILYIANIESHTVDLNDNEKKQIENYLSDAVGGQYVIYSMAMSLCSVFIWYKSFLLDGHLDKTKNLEKCKCIPNNDKEEQSSTSNYEGKVMPVLFDENGVAHCEDCMLPMTLENTTEGTNVKLKNIQPNTDPKTKDLYPYFAKFDIIKDS